MSDDSRFGETSFLRRWSSRKLAASRETASSPASPAPAPGSPPDAFPKVASADPRSGPPAPAAPPLPSIESLTFDSDFAAFLKPKVAESLRRDALRKLFNDPRFNVMDGLDVYIDDYTKFEPMTPEILAQLRHAKFVFDPPKTRVNAQGHVEDVPDAPPEDGAVEEAASAEAPPAADDRAMANEGDAEESNEADLPGGDDAAFDQGVADPALPNLEVPAGPVPEQR